MHHSALTSGFEVGEMGGRDGEIEEVELTALAVSTGEIKSSIFDQHFCPKFHG